MAEPLLWQILQRFKTNLAAITSDAGATYWYTPDAVYVVRNPNDQRLFDTSLGVGHPAVIYGVMRGERTNDEGPTGTAAGGGFVNALVDVHVLVSQMFTSQLPTETPEDALVAERMLRDVLRVMFLDVTLGGLVINVADQGFGMTDAIDQDSPPGWIVAEAVFRVSYSYQPTAA